MKIAKIALAFAILAAGFTAQAETVSAEKVARVTDSKPSLTVFKKGETHCSLKGECIKFDTDTVLSVGRIVTYEIDGVSYTRYFRKDPGAEFVVL